MLARLQRSVVFLLLAAEAFPILYFVLDEERLWCVALALVIPSAYGAILGLEFWLLASSYSPGDANRPRLTQLISAWWSEVCVAPIVFLWRQPFRSNAIRDSDAAATSGVRGVVLVHGFVCNRGLWNPWMKQLRHLDVPFVAVTLEPVFGSIDQYVCAIEAAVARLERATGRSPVLVGHSMGGLAIRAWLSRMGSSGRCRRVVTIATPHRGTALAHHAVSANGRQMRIEGPWLEALARAERPGMAQAFTCFWSHCDNIVFPTFNGTLSGAENRHLETTPHVRMVYHPDVFATVLGLVQTE